MTDKDKLGLVCQITSGYTFVEHENNKYIIDVADDNLVGRSIDVYNEVLQSSRFDEFLDKDHIEFYLVKYKVWKPADKNNIVELQKSLDDAKLELYSLFGMPKTQIDKTKKRIELIRKSLGEKLSPKHYLEQFTLEGYAEYVAELYLFSQLIYDTNYNKVELPDFKLDRIVTKYKMKLPQIDVLRLLARTEPWRSIWGANKNCFRKIGDEQRMLVVFTKMYDNVWEHPERPPDGVIDDDDMLDGWFIHMKKKVEEERRETFKNKLEQRHGDAKEIFVFTNSQEEAQEVDQMNNTRAKVIKQRIENNIKTKGYSKDLDIPELRLEAEQEARNG